jgi:hypothetical protein
MSRIFLFKENLIITHVRANDKSRREEASSRMNFMTILDDL